MASPHITVLYPFLPPAAIGAGDLARAVAAVRRGSSVRLHPGTGHWFGDSVVWLGPSDESPIRALTARGRGVSHVPALRRRVRGRRAAPDHRARADPAELRAAAEAVRPLLPIATEATEVTLMAGPDPGRSQDRRALAHGGVVPSRVSEETARRAQGKPICSMRPLTAPSANSGAPLRPIQPDTAVDITGASWEPSPLPPFTNRYGTYTDTPEPMIDPMWPTDNVHQWRETVGSPPLPTGPAMTTLRSVVAPLASTIRSAGIV